MKDEDLNKLVSNLRKSIEASHRAQVELLNVIEALMKSGTETKTTVLREVEPQSDMEAAPFSRRALQRSESATISVDEAAQYLGIGRARAYLAVKNGELPSLRLGSRILAPVRALPEPLAGREVPDAYRQPSDDESRRNRKRT